MCFWGYSKLERMGKKIGGVLGDWDCLTGWFLPYHQLMLGKMYLSTDSSRKWVSGLEDTASLW